MFLLNSFKSKLIAGGVVLAGIPLLVVMALTVSGNQKSVEHAGVECLKLGNATLDHIANQVYDMCQVEDQYLSADADRSSLAVGSQTLRQQVYDIKINQTGYVYVLDTKGNYVLSAGGKRNGENIWGAKDADGVLFIQELAAKAKAAPAGTVVEQRYPWKNKGDNDSRMKVARATYYEPWDWIIGASSYLDEFNAAEQQIAHVGSDATKAIGTTIVIALIMVAGAAFWGARKLANPLLKAVNVANAVAEGDLSHRLNMNSKDEIGTLADAVDRMSDQLQKNADVAKAIAEGDLAVQVQPAGPKDVFGKSLLQMTNRLNEILSGVSDAAERVNAGSREISDSSTSLSQGATEQAASLQEITSSLTELSSAVKVNADNAGQADQLTDVARDAGDDGVTQMGNMTEAMSEISNSSEEIAKIIKVIDDIAFQTNLLALNAAVEAARAGKHGKGFAVVAEEVRNLAGRSAKAARETAGLIEGSLGKVRNGTGIAEKTSESLSGIVTSVTKASDLVGEIAAASNEQAQGLAEISQGLSQIDAVTQQNTANSEETAAAAQELAGQARSLQDLMGRFQLRGRSQVARPAAAPAPQASYRAPASAPQAAPEMDQAWEAVPVGAGAPANPDEIIELSSGGWPE